MDRTTYLRLLSLLFFLILVTPASGQDCRSSLGNEKIPFNDNWYDKVLTQHDAKNTNSVNITALEQFFCSVAGSTSLNNLLLAPSAPLLLRIEFAYWENEAWQPGSAEQYGYDEHGFPTNTVFQSWDGDSWLNSSQAVFENDQRGRRLTFISQRWDGESWQNNSRRINTWNELDELVETVRQDWIEGTWVTHSRDLMSYENGLLIEQVLQTYEHMRWTSSFRYSQEYDNVGRQVRSLSEYYDSSALRWVANGQGAVVYGDNYSEVSFQSWDSEVGDWFTYSRSVNEFNDQGAPLLITHERRSLINKEWAFTRREMHNYNDTGLAAELVIQRFDGTDWQNDGLYTNTHDDAGNLISRLWSKWDSGQNAWSHGTLRTYEYVEATNLEEDDPYVPVSIDVYPLPVRDHVRIEIALGEPTQLTVNIYDVLGRQVTLLHDDPLVNGTVQIDWQPGDLPPGIYMARIQTGWRVETKKLVLVN